MKNPDEILKQLGRNVKSVRVKLGLSQEDLAERMNVNFQYISKIERGLQNMSIKKIVELSNYLGVELEKILDFK